MEAKYDAVREQYKTSDNLNTRISIHAKYSTNKMGFNNWIFSNYDISPNMKILELGCGTGEIWKSNLSLIDNSVQLTITDFSENMVSAVKKIFCGRNNVSFDIVNIEEIPYADVSFDRVIANMMLYHVSDIDKGLSEVRRVLSSGGYFYCATYGEHGIMEYISGLLKDYGVTDNSNKNFTLQNGFDILKKHFSNVKRLDYKDSLAVTNIEDLLDYIYSLTNISSAAEVGRDILREVLEKEMADGILMLPKEYRMFVCQK